LGDRHDLAAGLAGAGGGGPQIAWAPPPAGGGGGGGGGGGSGGGGLGGGGGTRVSRSRAMVSMRRRASVGPLAWHVDRQPPWPVFIAWIMSIASAPRTSPTTVRSGRRRRAARTRARAGGGDVTAGRAVGGGRPGLEADHVVAREAQLGGVLDRDHPLASRELTAERVEERGLAGPRGA